MTRLIKSLCLAGLLLLTTISCTLADQDVAQPHPADRVTVLEMCAPRSSMMAFLSREAWERPVAMGRTADGELMEVVASNLGGSWSVIVTDDEGIACVKMIGHNWKTLVILNYGRSASGRI